MIMIARDGDSAIRSMMAMTEFQVPFDQDDDETYWSKEDEGLGSVKKYSSTQLRENS